MGGVAAIAYDRRGISQQRQKMTDKSLFAAALLLAAMAFAGSRAAAADIKVLTAGAFKQIVVALAPEFEKQTGHKVAIENETVGALVKKIEGGEAFDVTFLSPGAVDDLVKKGKVADGSRVNIARVGVGVMVKEGAPKPDVATVEAFKQAVLAAKSVAYIDPASGGSSGIYVAKLFEQLGIADQVKPKAKLKQGGHVADLIASGEAELGIHQISEIVPVKGVTLIGPLPKEIQNYTTYAAGVASAAKDKDAAMALVRFLSGPRTAEILKSKGMEPTGS
jgi:molybdate transport system substrate-binding protein